MATAEIIAIGTELLLGDVLDTNSQFLALELANLGIDCFFRSTVGDNKDRLKSVLHHALDRSDIVITTGGLGPTPDDLTTETVAEFFDAQMVLDDAILARIEEFFVTRGYKMPPTNRKQALKPDGADWLPNPNGTAPGMIWKVSTDLLKKAGVSDSSRQRIILTFPGVPSELKNMWQQTAKNYLQTQFVEGTLWSCELKHYGIGESALAEQFSHLLQLANPTVAPYAGQGECRLRVAAKASNADDAQEIAQPVIDEIRLKSGYLCYGINKDTLESVVGNVLTERDLTLSVAESCTGGFVSKRLTDLPGSSRYIGLNVVTYSNEAKSKLLKIPTKILDEFGAVSSQCAKAMAIGTRKLSGSDIGLSITGIAGPAGGTDEKPVGLVYFALAAPGFCASKEVRYSNKLSREEIRFRSASEALNMVRMFLLAPDTFVNELDNDELKVNYFMTIKRGIIAQFKACELDVASMPVDEAAELRALIEQSGVLAVQNAFVVRAADLVSWKLIVQNHEGTHSVSSRAGQPAEDAEETGLEVTELLNFLNPYLEERLP